MRSYQSCNVSFTVYRLFPFSISTFIPSLRVFVRVVTVKTLIVFVRSRNVVIVCISSSETWASESRFCSFALLCSTNIVSIFYENGKEAKSIHIEQFNISLNDLCWLAYEVKSLIIEEKILNKVYVQLF